MSEALPWLQVPLAALTAAHAAGRLPQGLLIHDSPGAGGIRLVRQFAQLVLCSGDPAPCGQCANCRRVASGEHPDLHWIEPDPEAKLQQISVDRVREACDALVMTSYEGRGSVAIVQPADAMNHHAANALLKTLEEPRRGLHLVLITTRPGVLPATILSRCQVLRIRPPTREQALAWLQTQKASPDWAAALDALGGAVLDAVDADPEQLRILREDTVRALREARQGTLDVVRTAESWAKGDLLRRLNCIESYLTLRVLAGPEVEGGTAKMSASAHLPIADLDINIALALNLLDAVREIRQLVGTTLNKPLALERLLWRFARGGAGRARSA